MNRQGNLPFDISFTSPSSIETDWLITFSIEREFMHENLDEEQISHLWQHAMHSQNRFDNRLNFFLIFESVLLGVVASLYSKSPSSKPILITLICLGFFLTILWGYIQAREKFLFEGSEKRLKEVSPVYQETVLRRTQANWPLHSTPLLTYGVPTVVTLVWVVLFVFAVIM
jgi:hypothetical protein